MRIALIQTPIEDFYSTPQRTYPLGLTYLAGALSDLPVKIEIIDFLTGHGRQTIPIPVSFKPIIPLLSYDRSPISAFHTYYHWGMPWKNIDQFFANNAFDLFAISSNFYTYSEEAIKTAEIIKARHPNSIILLGGQNVGPKHDLFTSTNAIDLCIQGEGENAFRELITRLMNKKDISDIPGLWTRKSGKWNNIAINKKFDQQPAPHILPVDKYKIAGNNAMMIATSRGCPMGCSFCSVAHTFGSRMRLRPTNDILEEMRSAFARGIRAFDIEDDNFTFIRKHCVELLTAIKYEFQGKIKLYAMNGISAEHLDEEILSLLKECGMELLNLSIATSSEQQLKIIKRKTSIEHFNTIAKIASGMGFKVMAHFISGMPGQSLDEILNTMLLLSELPVVLGISPFYYIPGMDMDVPNIPPGCKEARLSRFWPADTLLDERDLITLFRLSRWINYVKKLMQKNNISTLAFQKISNTFPDDPYISSLTEHYEIIGLDSNNDKFTHKTSLSIIEQFVKFFNLTFIQI